MKEEQEQITTARKNVAFDSLLKELDYVEAAYYKGN